MTKITAPFSRDQVKSLNEFQQSDLFHGFTCPNHSTNKLIATPEGWICPQIDYKQLWAHDFMANWEWKEADNLIRTFLER